MLSEPTPGWLHPQGSPALHSKLQRRWTQCQGAPEVEEDDPS